MDEVLEGCGVDPNHTPVDRLPMHAQWALAEHFTKEGDDDGVYFSD